MVRTTSDIYWTSNIRFCKKYSKCFNSQKWFQYPSICSNWTLSKKKVLVDTRFRLINAEIRKWWSLGAYLWFKLGIVVPEGQCGKCKGRGRDIRKRYYQKNMIKSEIKKLGMHYNRELGEGIWWSQFSYIIIFLSKINLAVSISQQWILYYWRLIKYFIVNTN